jgi:Zn-dependent protease with chaperone function
MNFLAGSLAAYACISWISGAPVYAQANKSSGTTEKANAYKRAKELLGPDLYVVYRISERIIVANNLKRPIRVAVRSGIDSSGACEAVLGTKSDTLKCQALGLLPNIDRATNFDLWAAQVVSTMSGSPNAAAMSKSGTLYVNTAMLKEISGKPDQLACVIGHELAHITQNHGEEAQKKQTEYDNIAAEKISSAAQNAQKAQRSGQMWMAVLAGVSSGLSGNNSAIYNTQMQIAMSNMSAEIAAPQVAQAALQFSPNVGNAINSLQGLNASYIKRTWRDVETYLRDSALSMAGFSRKQEYEADLLGLEYITTAGFNPNDCIKLWTETMPHDKDKLIEKLLPKGVKDPALEPMVTAENAVPQAKSKSASRGSACFGKTRRDCDEDNSNEETTEAGKVSPEAMQSLASHPDHLSRAKALSNHMDMGKRNQLVTKGTAALKTTFIRDWNYDKQSESVVISSEFVQPKLAGSQQVGTSGIDVDKQLGF